MQRCKITVAMSITTVVTNKIVTVPEIAVLQHLHGKDAIRDITMFDIVEDFDNDVERERLFMTYEAVAREEERGFIDRLFPVASLLPTTLRQIGIDPQRAIRAMREQAEKLAAQADEMEAAADTEENPLDAEDTAALAEVPRTIRAPRVSKPKVDPIFAETGAQ
jgi:hypothetical protein